VASDREQERCLEHLTKLVGATLDSDAVRYEAVAALKRVLGFDRWAWPLADPETLITLGGIADHNYGPTIPRLLELEYGSEDFAGMRSVAQRRSPVASLTVETGADLARSRRWDEVLRPAGIGDEAVVACRDDFGCWGWLKVYRDDDQRSFGEQEIATMREAAPMLGAALRRSLACAFPDGAGTMRPPASLLLDIHLRPIAQTSGWPAWAGALPGAAAYAAFGMLPAMVYPVATLLRSGDPACSVRTLERASDGTWTIVEGASLEGAGEASFIVTLRRASSDETFDRLCRLYGLTSRERQVVAVVFSGLETRSASARLAISHHTLQDHLKSIFKKVGVRSRRELVARFGRPPQSGSPS
jgi:DNA-binding CsgD family transcriptional regulator